MNCRVLLLLLLSSACSLTPAAVYVSSTAGLRLEKVGELHWRHAAAAAAGPRLRVDVSRRFQQMDGFGGSFLRSGAIVLNKLPLHKQEEVLKHLFHPEVGAGLSVGKVPIGACDY